MDDGPATRPITWIGSSRTDLKRFPQQVRRDMGNALYAEQRGEVDPAAKPLRGFGGGSCDRGHTEMAKRTTAIALEASGGNVFADLGLPNPEQELLLPHSSMTWQASRAVGSLQRRYRNTSSSSPYPSSTPRRA